MWKWRPAEMMRRLPDEARAITRSGSRRQTTNVEATTRRLEHLWSVSYLASMKRDASISERRDSQRPEYPFSLYAKKGCLQIPEARLPWYTVSSQNSAANPSVHSTTNHRRSLDWLRPAPRSSPDSSAVPSYSSQPPSHSPSQAHPRVGLQPPVAPPLCQHCSQRRSSERSERRQRLLTPATSSMSD